MPELNELQAANHLLTKWFKFVTTPTEKPIVPLHGKFGPHYLRLLRIWTDPIAKEADSGGLVTEVTAASGFTRKGFSLFPSPQILPSRSLSDIRLIHVETDSRSVLLQFNKFWVQIRLLTHTTPIIASRYDWEQVYRKVPSTSLSSKKTPVLGRGFKIPIGYEFEDCVLLFVSLDSMCDVVYSIHKPKMLLDVLKSDFNSMLAHWAAWMRQVEEKHPQYLYKPFHEVLSSYSAEDAPFPGVGIYTRSELFLMAGLSIYLTCGEVIRNMSRIARFCAAYWVFAHRGQEKVSAVIDNARFATAKALRRQHAQEAQSRIILGKGLPGDPSIIEHNKVFEGLAGQGNHNDLNSFTLAASLSHRFDYAAHLLVHGKTFTLVSQQLFDLVMIRKDVIAAAYKFRANSGSLDHELKEVPREPVIILGLNETGNNFHDPFCPSLLAEAFNPGGPTTFAGKEPVAFDLRPHIFGLEDKNLQNTGLTDALIGHFCWLQEFLAPPPGKNKEMSEKAVSHSGARLQTFLSPDLVMEPNGPQKKLDTMLFRYSKVTRNINATHNGQTSNKEYIRIAGKMIWTVEPKVPPGFMCPPSWSWSPAGVYRLDPKARNPRPGLLRHEGTMWEQPYRYVQSIGKEYDDELIRPKLKSSVLKSVGPLDFCGLGWLHKNKSGKSWVAILTNDDPAVSDVFKNMLKLSASDTAIRKQIQTMRTSVIKKAKKRKVSDNQGPLLTSELERPVKKKRLSVDRSMALGRGAVTEVLEKRERRRKSTGTENVTMKK